MSGKDFVPFEEPPKKKIDQHPSWQPTNLNPSMQDDPRMKPQPSIRYTEAMMKNWGPVSDESRAVEESRRQDPSLKVAISFDPGTGMVGLKRKDPTQDPKLNPPAKPQAPSAPMFPAQPEVKIASTSLTPGSLTEGQSKQAQPQQIAMAKQGITEPLGSQVKSDGPNKLAGQKPSTPEQIKLAQIFQHKISVNQSLTGDALKVEAIRQTFGCTPAVAQQLLQARRKTGNIDGMFLMPSFENPNFLSSTPQYQYNITLSSEEYNWYAKYANSPPALRDVDLTIKEVQQQNLHEVALGAHEKNSAVDTHRTLGNRGNYARLLRTINQQKLGQDKVPTDLSSQLAVLSPEQRAIYERKLQTIQTVYGESPIDLRQGIFDQVQFETRLDVMEISALGRSLDDKRRQRLQKLYDGKSDAFKDKAEQSVSAGFNDRWGVDPVFGKETSGKVKRTLRDRYLIQSDRRAMEIAYLGRPLSAQQRDAAEAFYKKLSPEQKQAYSQRVQAEFDLTWGNDAPAEKVSGQIKWVLRAQMLEQDFAKQVFRMPESQQAKVQSKGQPGQTDSTLLGGFQQRVQQKSQDLLNRNKQRLNTEQQGYSQDTNPKSSRWQALWQAAHQTRQLETQEQQLELKLQQLVSQRYRVLPRQPGMSNEQYAQAQQVHEGKLNARHIELDQQLRHFHQQRMNLRYAFPALAAVEDKDLQNQDVASVQQRIPQKFDGIRGDIDRLNGQLTQDPSVGLMMDAVVNQQLAGITDPTQKQKLRQWVKAQQESRQADQVMMGTLAGLSGLAGLGISFTPLAPAAPPLFAQATVLGTATAVMAIPDLAVMHQAAQAGRGGAGQLTNKSPEQALWELALGGANVTLAAADVGLGAKQMAQLSRTAQELSQSGVTLSQGQWHDGLKAAQEGEGALQQFITGLKNASAAAKDKIRRVLAGSKDPQTEIAGVPRSTFDQVDEAKQLSQPMRSQGNNRSSGKGKGKDTPTPQEQSPWRQPLPERLTTPNGNPIPYGFKSFEEYQAYGKFLRTEAPEGTAVFFQGSSVTGRNSKTGAVFDVGRRSDFDVALANQSIFNRAKQLGYKAKDGARIGPLNNDQLARLGLLDYAKKARETSGRTTEFMLFDTSKSARTRPSIEVLLEEEGL